MFETYCHSYFFENEKMTIQFCKGMTIVAFFSADLQSFQTKGVNVPTDVWAQFLVDLKLMMGSRSKRFNDHMVASMF